MKFFLNELPWWARLDSGLDWSTEERIVSGVILSCGCFFSLVPFFGMDFLLKSLGIGRHNAALISVIVTLPLSVYLIKIAYRGLWPDYYGRAEANAMRRLEGRF